MLHSPQSLRALIGVHHEHAQRKGIRKMKALVFDGPWKMEVRERDARSPGPGEVQVRIEATGICGSDIHGYTGTTGRRHEGQVMGHETVGRISALGSGVKGMSEGDLVTINPVMSCGVCSNCVDGSEQSCSVLRVFGVVPDLDAAFAEFATIPQQNIVLLPHLKKSHLGALIEPLAVGFHAARISNIDAGSDVLIIGGGPIGQAAALAARRLGAGRVIVSELSQKRIDLLTSLGMTCVHPANVEIELADLSATPSVVIDAVGNSETMAIGLTLSSTRSRIVLVGMAEPSLTIPAYRVSVDERIIMGSFCYSYRDFRETADWVSSHEEEVAPLIDRTIPLDQGPQIFDDLGHQTIDAHKILLTPRKQRQLKGNS
jgi:threonine dehydrogenase-like Zn-dependent dehydrogenase